MNRKADIAAIGYAIQSTGVDLRLAWKLNCILVVSLALGMLLPMLCLGNINVFVQKYSTIGLKDESNTLVASFRDGYELPSEIECALEQHDVNYDRFALLAVARVPVTHGDLSKRLYVYYVSEDWQTFETIQLVEGSLNISSGERLCLVDESMREHYQGLAVGDTVTISGIPYTVAGIFSALDHKSVIIPLSDGEWESVDGLTLNNLYIHAPEGLPDYDRVTEALLTLNLTYISLLDGRQVYQNTLRVSLRQATAILAVGLAAFVYASINISLVFTGKLMEEKRTIGIRMAVGASPQLIVLEALVENLLCYGVAYLMDIGLVQLLRPTYPEELKLVMDSRVYFISFIFGATMVFAITLCSVRWLKKQKPAELMERVS